MNSNLESVFMDHLNDDQKSNVQESILRKALQNLRSTKTLEHDGYSVFRMEFKKRKRGEDDAFIQTLAKITKILEYVDTLYKDQKENGNDITKQHFERVTNSPIEPVTNIPEGYRHILSLDRLKSLKGLPAGKSIFVNNVTSVVKNVSNYTTKTVNGALNAKQPNGLEYELIPIKHMIISSEPNCKEQLFHRDFSRDVLEHAVFNKKCSLYILMFALTPRYIRCCDESHKLRNSYEDKKGDQEDDSFTTIGLLKGTAVVMHPWLIHSGGSNDSSCNSVCLLSYVVMRDKADKIHERFEVFDKKLTTCIAQHGWYRGLP
mmetsp:Transcript_36759/g.58924  ORF Transcript_36759/g.58924 Transcript_36759/m.58924 type:complete len:318 (-) Transcript_36759:353-1306(-)